MKKYLSIILLFGLICFLLAGCQAEEDSSAEQGLFNLKTEDIISYKVTLRPPNSEITITNEKKTVELVTILNKVITYEQDDSYKEYYGQWVEFELAMVDDSLKTVVAYNPFIIIDGVGYKTEYEPCEELNAFANSHIN